MIAPEPVYRTRPAGPPHDLLSEVRDLLAEYPFLAGQDPETVTHALHVLRGLGAEVFGVEVAMEALVSEDLGVLA